MLAPAAIADEVDTVIVDIPATEAAEAAKYLACSLFSPEELKQIEGLNFDHWKREQNPGDTVSRCKYVSANALFVYVEMTDTGTAEAAQKRYESLRANLTGRHFRIEPSMLRGAGRGRAGCRISRAAASR